MPTTDTAPSPAPSTPSNPAKPEAPPAELHAQLAQAQAELAETRAALAAAERRNAIESELLRAGTIDLETSSILADRSLKDHSPASVARVVAEMKQRKPYLFRAGAGGSISSASVNGDSDRPINAIEHEARSSGDRRALLRYLRAKRGG